MDVTAVNPSAIPSQPQPAASSAAAVDYNAFLRLLIAQMQNQDPLNPMDSTEYMAQLAQFSSVEQSIQTNQKLDGLLSSLSLSQADALIGRSVSSATGDVSGVVEAINITSQGSIALLEGGASLPLGAGITIR